jgi:hypothetical protein
VSTHCTTIILDKPLPMVGIYKKRWPSEICAIYRQWDGNPTGHGSALASFRKCALVNGIRNPDAFGKEANGMDCFAAQLIAILKGKTIGNIYIQSPAYRYCEAYTYVLFPSEDPMTDGAVIMCSVFKRKQHLDTAPLSMFTPSFLKQLEKA